MKYINEYLRKKKPETFVDYNPGEIPKKSPSPKPLTLGEVAPKATERVAPRVTTKEESTYITSNKDLQNIHRNRTNAERHTGRSLRDESNRRTTYVGDGILDVPHFHTDSMESYKPRRGGVPSPPALFPYDYGRAQRPSPTNSNDGNHIAITNENNSSNPYGSPVKIVGDNVTKKDYDDFWNAFHEERTGSKLNWAANQMQTQPKAQEKTQRQSTPQNTRSRDMMHWAMNSSGNLATPQNPVLTNELRDIEAAEKGDANSEWYKRLEAAWEAGDLEAYEKVEREMKAQKERANYILNNRQRTYDDDFFGQFGANYRMGRMAQDEALAWNEYYKSPTKENKAYAESISDTLGYFRQNNAETLADDAILPWLSQSLAGNLPQMIDQTKAGLAGAAGVGMTTGFLTAASGNPLVAGTAALNGAKLGYSAATAKQSYDVMRGATFKRLIEQGLDEETARAAANDEAVLSSLIEMADSGMDVNTAIDVVFNPKAAGVKGVLGILGKAGLNVAGEALEESLQEGISIANENRGGSGIFDLVKNAGITYGDALTRDGEARRRILEAGAEGAKLAAMTSAPGIIGGGAYKVHSDLPDVQVEGEKKIETGNENVSESVFEDTFSLLFKHIDGKECFPENHDAFGQQGWQDITDPRQINAGNKARVYVKNGIKIIYEDGEAGARGFKGVDHYHIINPNATNSYDMYLDQYGNPTPKNSKQSHILKKRRGE